MVQFGRPAGPCRSPAAGRAAATELRHDAGTTCCAAVKVFRKMVRYVHEPGDLDGGRSIFRRGRLDPGGGGVLRGAQDCERISAHPSLLRSGAQRRRAEPHDGNAVLVTGKMVYRQASFDVGKACRAANCKIPEELYVGSAASRHQNSRSDARAGGAAVGADAGRSRRRGDQDRAAGRRRRCARLRPALPQGSRRQSEQQQLVLSVRQPQQEIGHRQHRYPARPGHRPRAGKVLRRHDGELQGRRSQALPAGLRIDQGDQSRHHLLLGDRLRADRALRATRRLRRDPAGDGRPDERHRPYRRRARRGADEGRPLHRRLHDRHEHLDRHSRRALSSQGQWRGGAAGRRLPVRHRDRLAVALGPDLSRQRHDAAAARHLGQWRHARGRVPLHRRRTDAGGRQ